MSIYSGYRDRRFAKRRPDFFSPHDDREEIGVQTQTYRRAVGGNTVPGWLR